MGNSQAKTQSGIDLARYAGKWYKIGGYPDRYEAGCVSSTAEYIVVPGSNGQEVTITNVCYCYDPNRATLGYYPTYPNVQSPAQDELSQFNLKICRQSQGLGRLKGNNLEVSFEGSKGHGTYKILWTDYTNFSFVAGDNDSYWILCRRPTITLEEFRFIREMTLEFKREVSHVELTINGGKVVEETLAGKY